MDLKKNAPKGEFLAYINKKEAAMLKKAGGSGKLVNGIPSFEPQGMAGKYGMGAGVGADGKTDTKEVVQTLEEKNLHLKHIRVVSI